MVAEEEYVSYVRQFSDTVLRIAVNYCKELPDAEDMVQEVFLKLYETGTDFTDEEHVKRWLIRVTINTCKNHLASSWRRRTQLMEFQTMESVLEQSAELYAADVSGVDEESALFEAVASLPEKYRSVVHLYYYEDYSVKEIADILKLTQGNVKVRLSRGRLLLRNTLKEDWEDDE